MNTNPRRGLIRLAGVDGRALTPSQPERFTVPQQFSVEEFVIAFVFIRVHSWFHLLAVRLCRKRCRRMKASNSTPTAIFVHHELRVPSNVMMVWMTPRMSTPINVPKILPTPPERGVPPMTTAAIASSSSIVPAVALPDDV